MCVWDFPGGSDGKSLSATQETQIRSLHREDPLEKEMATIPVFLPREFHGKRSLAGHSPSGCKESYMTEGLTHTQTHTHTRMYN